MVPSNDQITFIKTLCELVRDDGLKTSDAIKMFRDEFKVGLVYCSSIGLISMLQQVESAKRIDK